MTDEVYVDSRAGLAGKARDLAAGAKDALRAALREAMAWDFYKWTVLALMTATFILIALSYGGIRAELAALKEERGNSADGAASVNAAIDKQMADMKAALQQSLTDMKAGLDASVAKINAKLDAKTSQPPKPAAPAVGPKPAVKPKPQ